MSVEPKPRPLNHLWNTAQVVGVVVTLTGFTPERWISAFLDFVRLPAGFENTLFSGVDFRFAAVGVGVSIIAADVFFRHRKERRIALATVPTVQNTQPLAEDMDGSDTKPSIAVLPFVNMSDDKSQEYFADGMTEDIITGLSCDSRLFVIARNSTFAYKGQSPDIRTVGKELGVRYVLEGSIRPVKDRLRITVQLIETATGAHIWADKIDRPAAEIFDVMDEVVDDIVMALCANLGVTESHRAQRARPEDMQAWALRVQAEVLYFSQPSAKTVLEAEKLARRATDIEPGFAQSWALLAYLISVRIAFGLNTELAKDSAEALTLVSKALGLAPNDPTVLGYCGYAVIWVGQTTQGIGYLERSLEINPNNSNVQISYGAALWAAGRTEAGVAQLELFIRRARKDPFLPLAYLDLALCYLVLGNFEKAEQASLNVIKHSPGFTWGYLTLGMSLTGLGRDGEAQVQLQKMHEVEPDFTRQHVEDFLSHTLLNTEHAEKMIAQVRQAWRD